MDDFKKDARHLGNEAKETWRRADGEEDLGDKLANLGDDIRDGVADAGDTVRDAVDDADDRV